MRIGGAELSSTRVERRSTDRHRALFATAHELIETARMPRAALSSINLNLLVALDAVLQTRSVSDAARRTRVTKSAMSHSLSALRHLLDDPLLVRVGGRMALTPHAEALRE